MAKDDFKTRFAAKFLELAQSNPRFNKNGAADVIIQEFLDPVEDGVLIHQVYARFAMENENYDEAHKHLKAILEAEPDHEDALGSMGECLFKMHRYGEAIPYFARDLKKFPGDYSLKFRYAYSLFKTDNVKGAALLEKSMADYDDLIQIYPDEMKDVLQKGLKALKKPRSHTPR